MSMRTLERRKSAIKWQRPTIVMGSLGSQTVSWGTPTALRATVQPLSSAAVRAEYGERADRMMQIFVPNGDYRIGDGIWIDGESSSDPPWIVVSVAKWLDLTVMTVEMRV